MTYNGLNQRLAMSAASVTSQYVMDTSKGLSASGNRPLTATTGGNTTSYLYGMGAIAEQTADWSYALMDGTNTQRQLTDSLGAITYAARYTPWGDTFESYGTGGFSFGYFGGVMDAATGLLYVGEGQYYDPSTGRFLTRNARPNQNNPYLPFDPMSSVVAPLGLLAILFSRRKKGSKWGAWLALVLVVASVGLGLMACNPGEVTITITPVESETPTATPMVRVTVTTEDGTIEAIVPTSTPLPPTLTPEPDCPAPLSSEEDEAFKRRIEDEFGIIIGDPREVGSEYWKSVQIQIIYNALSQINAVLGGNLKSFWLGGHLVSFYKYKNSEGDGFYYGKAHDVEKINFFIVNTFPHHLIYHEMGHILDNAQGERFTNSLETTEVHTGYPDQSGERVMGGTPYNRIDGKGFISDTLNDPCGAVVDAELHPASDLGNDSGEEWGDLFANYVSGNFDTQDGFGHAKYQWVHDQLFGG